MAHEKVCLFSSGPDLKYHNLSSVCILFVVSISPFSNSNIILVMAYSASSQPALYGGYGKEDDKPFGGLKDRFFDSRCPPIITTDTIIIAVCGPNDYRSNAHPNADGWFFSDFYLFHHLFRGTAKQQYRLTCVEPEMLIEKYTEYGHGDPRLKDRRIVLDSMMKEEVKDVLVFDEQDLLERFLSYVADASKKVKDTNRPILVLIFRHGAPELYSITIGGKGKFENCPRLNRFKFREALLRHNSNPNVAFLTTACFGEGWCQTIFLNIAVMAGVDEEHELLSWSQSASLSRCCGFRYATGVAQALIKSEIEGFSWITDEGEEVRESHTYASLVKLVHDTLVKEVDVREENDISFSAKDDVWDMEWRARTGFPLTNYKEKWELLRRVDKGAATDISQSASIRFSDTIRLSTPQAEYRLKRLAFDYMKSFPGPDAAAKNHRVHNDCNRLLKDEALSNDELERLAEALRYRLETMDRGTKYKDRLGVPFLDCRECDVWDYRKESSKNLEKRARHSQIFKKVGFHDLFDPPSGEAMPYVKGQDYLTAVLTESGWSSQKIDDALDNLVKVKRVYSNFYALLFLERHIRLMFVFDSFQVRLAGTTSQYEHSDFGRRGICGA